MLPSRAEHAHLGRRHRRNNCVHRHQLSSRARSLHLAFAGARGDGGASSGFAGVNPVLTMETKPMRRLISLTFAALAVSSFPVWAGSPLKAESSTIPLKLTRFGVEDTIQRSLAPFILSTSTFASPFRHDIALDLPRAELGSDRLWALSLVHRWK